MTTLRMGFCGGCISHQRGIPLNQLFHRVLSDGLTKQAGHGLRIVISHGFSRPTPERVGELLSRRVDFVLLQARWLPAVTNSRWIIKRIDGQWASLHLNPRFWLAEHLPLVARLHWKYPLRRLQSRPGSADDAEEVYSRASFASRLNVAAGLLLGVAAQARREAARDLLEAVDLLCASGVPTFMMSAPPIWQSGRAGHRIGEDMNRSLQAIARLRGVSYVNLLDGWQAAFLQSDGLHPTPLGHSFMAARLLQEIGPGLVALGSAARDSRRR